MRLSLYVGIGLLLAPCFGGRVAHAPHTALLPENELRSESRDEPTMTLLDKANSKEPRGRQFVGWTHFAAWNRIDLYADGTILTSPEVPCAVAANEIVASWNADVQGDAWVEVQARAHTGDHWTKYYVLGRWAPGTIPNEITRKQTPDANSDPANLDTLRHSVNGQKDADGTVNTDTLALNTPADRVQLRITLHIATHPTAASPTARPLPTLKLVGVSLADTHSHPGPLEPNKAAWGKEIEVPAKTQTGYPDQDGWCSPTSTAMTLAFWGKKRGETHWDLPVPLVAQNIYDPVYKGTGNWPFNTAFAGTFPGLQAYVTRFSDLRELEDWTAVGLPVVVSVSYDLLLGKAQDNDPGHLMVCDGWTKDGDIVLNDPAYHPDRGESCRRVFARDRFVRAWTRSKFLVYLIYPEGTNVPTDHYGHWLE